MLLCIYAGQSCVQSNLYAARQCGPHSNCRALHSSQFDFTSMFSRYSRRREILEFHSNSAIPRRYMAEFCHAIVYDMHITQAGIQPWNYYGSTAMKVTVIPSLTRLIGWQWAIMQQHFWGGRLRGIATLTHQSLAHFRKFRPTLPSGMVGKAVRCWRPQSLI